MKYFINTGTDYKALKLKPHIVYAHRTDLNGDPYDLDINVIYSPETPKKPSEDFDSKSVAKPCIIFLPGQGWRFHSPYNEIPDISYFAQHGYVVVYVRYSSSAQATYPQQIIDVKSALRFVRSHCEEYEVDPERICVWGRSAGGQLTVVTAMNTDDFINDEYPEVSSQVNCAIDMFGPVNFTMCYDINQKRAGNNAFYGWKTVEDTHEGALFKGDMDTLRERMEPYNAVNYLSDKMCPLLIMHGDNDQAVDVSFSDVLYESIEKAGLDDRTDYYVLHGANHGSAEFSQPETRGIMLRFLEKYLSR